MEHLITTVAAAGWIPLTIVLGFLLVMAALIMQMTEKRIKGKKAEFDDSQENYPLRYVFEPQEDMTAYELARLLQHTRPSLSTLPCTGQEMPARKPIEGPHARHLRLVLDTRTGFRKSQ